MDEDGWWRGEMLHKEEASTPILARALMLHADPQLVHLCEIKQQELECIIDVPAITLIL